ncbi:MAG: universal stress protein [Thermomicrobiaceae bacterium]
MIKSVIIPLDGSDLAVDALPLGKMIAQTHNADVHLVCVIANDAEASAEDKTRAYLEDIASDGEGNCRIHVRIGNAADEIVDAADEIDDGIIVMTTHGRTGIGRWLYGSVAEKVVHGAETPVLLIRSGTGLAGTDKINRIMVPLDGSAYSEGALRYGKSLASAFGGELLVVRVTETASLYTTMGYEAYGPTAGEPMADVVETMIRDNRKYIEKLVTELRDEGYTVEGSVLEGFAGEQIVQFEKTEKPDLVVMATHGRSGFDRLVFGSVAERVLKTGTTPVLMVRPSGVIEE